MPFIPADYRTAPQMDIDTDYPDGTVYIAMRDHSSEDTVFLPVFLRTTDRQAALDFVRRYYMPCDIRVVTPTTTEEAA